MKRRVRFFDSLGTKRGTSRELVDRLEIIVSRCKQYLPYFNIFSCVQMHRHSNKIIVFDLSRRSFPYAGFGFERTKSHQSTTSYDLPVNQIVLFSSCMIEVAYLVLFASEHFQIRTPSRFSTSRLKSLLGKRQYHQLSISA